MNKQMQCNNTVAPIQGLQGICISAAAAINIAIPIITVAGRDSLAGIDSGCNLQLNGNDAITTLCVFQDLCIGAAGCIGITIDGIGHACNGIYSSISRIITGG